LSSLPVPTPQRQLLATGYGLLINELLSSPETVVNAALSLLQQALDLDTGDPAQSTTPIITFVVELACRVENSMSFLTNVALGTHESFSHLTRVRDYSVPPMIIQQLQEGLAKLQRLLRQDAFDMIDHWVER